jgi:DNA processing protein
MQKFKIRKLLKKEFPTQLLEIPDSPKQLYIRGTMPEWNSNFLCVVGSRKFSNYGREACEQIISGLRGYDITIISGLALGIDSIALKAGLDAGLKTIAIPGSGLDTSVLYPRANHNLAKNILESGGALISELEPMFKATLYSFPQRNRIMAGLSRTLLVIEAGKKSGTLITARLALDYNKEICVIPGSIFQASYKGANWLLKQGAVPITSSKDLLEIFGFNTQKNFEQQKLILENCSIEEKQILKILNTPLSKDQIIRQIKMPASKINTLISAMEINGLIKEVGGEIIRI